ncbi:MAG: DUF4867 family protein [Lachnospiraceae bacterium]
MQILPVNSPDFRKYGRVINNIDFCSLVEKMKETPVPDGVVYEPSIPELESLTVKQELSNIVYGEMPVQIGYCNGHNTLLNGLEYHCSPEVNVPATDAVLMLGLRWEMESDFTYDTSMVKAFLIPAGTGVELYTSTLHYAPCGVDGNGFQVAIILPKGTNYPLQENHSKVLADGTASSEDALLVATNKWLIGHSQGGFDSGTFCGLKGENLNIL